MFICWLDTATPRGHNYGDLLLIQSDIIVVMGGRLVGCPFFLFWLWAIQLVPTVYAHVKIVLKESAQQTSIFGAQSMKFTVTDTEVICCTHTVQKPSCCYIWKKVAILYIRDNLTPPSLLLLFILQ